MTLMARYGLRLVSLGLLVGLGLAPLSAMAQQAYPPAGVLATQGHGEIKVHPDSLSVNVSVQNKADTLPAARTLTNQQMQAIISALKALNISGLKLETQGVNVYPIQGASSKNKLSRVIGYEVSNSLNVSVLGAPLDKLGEDGSKIVDTALSAGATNVGGLDFFLNDMAAARGKALELAVKDAQNNAQAMAKAANISLTGIYNMEGNPQYGGYAPRPMFAMKTMAVGSAAAEATPMETGDVTVSSDVTIRFKF